ETLFWAAREPEESCERERIPTAADRRGAPKGREVKARGGSQVESRELAAAARPSRPALAHRGAGTPPHPGAPPDPPWPHGGVAVRLPPRGPGGDGARPLHDAHS